MTHPAKTPSAERRIAMGMRMGGLTMGCRCFTNNPSPHTQS
jgi:hypothetical protein